MYVCKNKIQQKSAPKGALFLQSIRIEKIIQFFFAEDFRKNEIGVYGHFHFHTHSSVILLIRTYPVSPSVFQMMTIKVAVVA